MPRRTKLGLSVLPERDMFYRFVSPFVDIDVKRRSTDDEKIEKLRRERGRTGRSCAESSVCTKTRRWRCSHRQLVRSELHRTNLRNSRPGGGDNHPIMVRRVYSFGGLVFHLIRLIRDQRSPDQSLMISRVNRVIILSVWSLIDQQDVMHEFRWSRAATLRPYMVHRPQPSEGCHRLKSSNAELRARTGLGMFRR